MLQKFLNATLLSLAMLLAACGGGDDNVPDTGNGGLDPDPTAGCTVEDEKQAVHELMNDVYYWYQDVPDADPADFASKEALLDFLIQPEKDIGKKYSYLTTVEAEDAFLSNAAYTGFGFSMARDSASGRVFLREVFEGGPAHDAGMRRGDEITEIDGADVASMSADQLNAALGPDEAGYTVVFSVRHADDSVDDYEVAKDEVNSTVVGEVRHDLGAAGDISYIYFRSFVDPAFDQLDEAFAAMKTANDTRLVLDLRYNGGGLVSVAGHLGGLIAGQDHEGEILTKLEYNDRYQQYNQEYLVELLANSVDITDIVIITTPASASASEMVINGLKPFEDTITVTTVGSTTYGKPVGQNRLEFCETEILRAVTFKAVNANDQGEYYNGIEPECAAEDDILREFGDPDEASLSGALYYLANGSCDMSASLKASREHARKMAVQPQGDPLVRDGWDVLTGNAR